MNRSNFVIEEQNNEKVIIRDVGPWDVYMTVTNNVENVVKFLTNTKVIDNNKKLYCYDSEGDLDEIVHVDGQFVKFMPFRNHF